MIKPTG